MGKIVEKKILPEYLSKVSAQRKTFEIRKDEDDIQTGDILILRGWDGEKYTGKKTVREVTYVLRDVPQYGLQEGYCIIAMQPRGWDWIRPSDQEVQPKGGQWIKIPGTEYSFACSNCGETTVHWDNYDNYDNYDYCPKCGARLFMLVT